jgi:hypothetical protein
MYGLKPVPFMTIDFFRVFLKEKQGAALESNLYFDEVFFGRVDADQLSLVSFGN